MRCNHRRFTPLVVKKKIWKAAMLVIIPSVMVISCTQDYRIVGRFVRITLMVMKRELKWLNRRKYVEPIFKN
jgi:hypothetical protein